MKLSIKRKQEEITQEITVREAGLFRNKEVRFEKRILFKMDCKLLLSDDEEQSLAKYKAISHVLTWHTCWRRESGAQEVGEIEYTDQSEASRHGDHAVPALTIAQLKDGKSYTELDGPGGLFIAEEKLLDACRKFKNRLKNYSTYGGEEELDFD